jgi:hypothetical protein
MIFHVVSILKAGLGAAVVALAVVLWSRFRRFSSGILAVSSILLYAVVILELLDLYDLFEMGGPIFRGQPLFRSVISLLLLASMFMTLFVFIREEKK